jgi:hypothetical protein
MTIGRTIEHALRYPVALVCAYEAFAIVSRKAPTISSICWEHNIFTPIILGGLAAHLIIHEIEQASE